MAHANVLCGRLGSSTSQYTCTTVIIWDTGVSFVLTTFKINFIDYLKYNTPVKDVIKVDTSIGIGKTIHFFIL